MKKTTININECSRAFIRTWKQRADLSRAMWDVFLYGLGAGAFAIIAIACLVMQAWWGGALLFLAVGCLWIAGGTIEDEVEREDDDEEASGHVVVHPLRRKSDKEE